MAMAGRRFFGWVIGGSLPATVAANWLAAAWDQNAAGWQSSPAAAAFEQVAQRWLLDALGLPPDCAAGFVTGATMANFACLAAARQTVLKKAGWDVEADGLFGAPPITVVVGDEVHVSVLKALGLLGLGRNRVLRVPVDDQGRMRADRFPAVTGPAIVCLQAGNVNTGAVDPVGGTAVCSRAVPAPGFMSTAPSDCGPRLHRGERRLLAGVSRRRFLGDRRSQMAQRPL